MTKNDPDWDKEFEVPNQNEDREVSRSWSPEEFGFVPHKINDTMTRDDIFYRDDYQLRKLQYDRWLCTKKKINKKGNAEYMVRFYCTIHPDEIEFATMLLTKGLR